MFPQPKPKSQNYLDIQALIEILNQHNIAYVLIGTVGAIAHGARLNTNDFDICNCVEPDNLQRLTSALKVLRARPYHKSNTIQNAIEKGDWQTLGLDKSTKHHLYLTLYGMLDIVPEPFGSGGWGQSTNYKHLVKKATTMSVFDIPIQVASFTDIWSAKKALKRPQDMKSEAELMRIYDQLEQGIQPDYDLEKFAVAKQKLN